VLAAERHCPWAAVTAVWDILELVAILVKLIMIPEK